MGVDWFSADIYAKATDACERGLDELSNKIVKSAQASMRLPKHGRDYRKAWRKQGKKRAPKGVKSGYYKNVSSAPFEAPAVQQGRLIASVHFTKLRKLTRKVGSFGQNAAVQSGYPLYTEIGTSKMEARPWLRPALYEHTGRTGEEIFERLMD